MKCATCDQVNPDHKKYCRECGAKLHPCCPQCGDKIEADDRFCGECGCELKASDNELFRARLTEEKLEQIKQFIPLRMSEKMLAQRDRFEGERKQVTIMFCDMAGFTHITEMVAPELLYSVMDRVYEILIRKVHQYEGLVNQMTGDGVMAIFGAPIAIEDAPQRAIRAGLAIHRELVRLSNKLKSDSIQIPEIRMRVGINSGQVILGNLGSDLRLEFKAVGDTVNLASRIEGLAEPGTTYVTEATFKLTEGLFRFEHRGQRAIKGKTQPVTVYRVISPLLRRTRFDVHAERGLAPFMGRKRELELLMDSLERVKAGSGQVVVIVAEAGLGKSRLLYEFRKAILNEDVTFFEGRCLSYSRKTDYYLAADILKSELGITDDEPDESVRKKVAAGIRRYGADEDHTLPYLLEILSVKDSGIDNIPVIPETKRDRIFEAIKRFLIGGALKRPLVLAVEDLHWADSSSAELLKELLISISGHRVLLILTHRPDGAINISGKSYIHQINLLRFTNRQTLNMARSILQTDTLDSALEDLLLQRTEGVPLFVEEYIHFFKDLQIISIENGVCRLIEGPQALAVPATIQDVILSRVDRLPETVRDLLITGAVIEREFDYELIRQVTGLSERKLLSMLSILKDAELLYEHGIFPEITYVFRHSLTREVLYNAILPDKKKGLHARIGNAIETIHGHSVEEKYGMLVDHFMAGGLMEKGAEYATKASKKAARAVSYMEAIGFMEKCLHCLERLPKDDVVAKMIIDARVVMAGYYLYLTQPAKAKAVVDPVVALAEALSYEKRLPAIYTILGTYAQWVEEDFEKGRELLEKAIVMTRHQTDHAFYWGANYVMGVTCCWQCRFEESIEFHNNCLNQMTAMARPGMIATSKAAISAYTYCLQGRLADAATMISEAMEDAYKSDEQVSIGIAEGGHGVVLFYRGYLDEALPYLVRGIEGCRRKHLLAWSSYATLYLGMAHFEKKQYDASSKALQEMIAFAEESNKTPSWINLGKAALARTRSCLAPDGVEVDALIRQHGQCRLKAPRTWMAILIGEILMASDRVPFADAGKWIEQAVAASQDAPLPWHRARLYILYADYLRRIGDYHAARMYHDKAVVLFLYCGADGWAEKYAPPAGNDSPAQSRE